jgi:short-subunit dehydrogenase
MKAIIIGATSGIGRELAKQMSHAGYEVGVTGRRSDLLDSLEQELPGQCYTSHMDLTDVDASVTAFEQLLKTMGNIDIVVINSGTGSIDPQFPLQDELATVAVNVTGFTAIANLAYHYFAARQQGHIVGISSMAAIKGGVAADYHASKAYVSTYLEGLSCRAAAGKKNICVTDIRPGFVDTAMAQGDGIFWMAPVEKAAQQMFDAIKKKRRIAYITKRWRLIGIFLSLLPFSVYRKIAS